MAVRAEGLPGISAVAARGAVLSFAVLALFVGGVLAVASWLVGRADPSLDRLYAELISEPLTGDELPPGLTFGRWATSPDRPVRQEGHRYAAAYFVDHDHDVRIGFAVYGSHLPARQDYEGHAASDLSSVESVFGLRRSLGRPLRPIERAAFFSRPPGGYPSFCRTQGNYGECVALVGRIVVIGEARLPGAQGSIGHYAEPRGRSVELAAVLMRAGVLHAEKI